MSGRYTGFQTSRFEWSAECGKIAERDIYKPIMNAVKIHRFEQDFIDRTLGIDIAIQSNERQYTIAECFRSNKDKKYQDLTIRYESKYNVGRLLEVQMSTARYKLVAYADTDVGTQPTKLTQWLLVNLQDVLDEYQKGTLPYVVKHNKDQSSSFMAIKFDDLRRLGLIRTESSRFEKEKKDEPISVV